MLFPKRLKKRLPHVLVKLTPTSNLLTAPPMARITIAYKKGGKTGMNNIGYKL